MRLHNASLSAYARNSSRIAVSSKPMQVAPMIKVDGLVKRYQKAERNAVDGVSFDVAPGEFFSLLGPNGAGKTTTISILTTTLAATGGRVTIDGHDLANDAAGVRRSAGITFQTPSLDRNLSAEENVRLHAILYGLYPWRPTYRTMPAAYRKRLGELADVVGLGAEIFKPVRTYSGGMRRSTSREPAPLPQVRSATLSPFKSRPDKAGSDMNLRR